MHLGIIPARAGFTDPEEPHQDALADHPRSRGVYYGVRLLKSRAPGSSPLARGLQVSDDFELADRRIIPARAGFTETPGREPRGLGDHPRSRGVYVYSPDDGAVLAGSSPLARGLPTIAGHEIAVSGIIPARAGFTFLPARALEWPTDHPRSRGVYPASPAGTSPPSGSSPLARGLPIKAWDKGRHRRIIPARAGFTRTGGASSRCGPDHPRSRGVYPTTSKPSATRSGSSPLARGLRGDEKALARFVGIIPARAGFTHRRRRHAGGDQDHPRSRGVYALRQ